MINEETAQVIVNQYQEALKKFEENKTDQNLKELNHIENICLDKLSYLVKMRVGKYRKFSNYDDLYQEGMIVLSRAMKNYSSDKGSFFWWAHKYIGTKVFRSANHHSTIKIPLKVAKNMTPYKEVIMPILIEPTNCPDTQYESAESSKLIQKSIEALTTSQQQIIDLAFGLKSNNPLPVHKICNKLKISRAECKKILNGALKDIKKNLIKQSGGEKISFSDNLF